MNPMQVVADIKKDLGIKTASCNSVAKVYTEKDVNDKMLKLVNAVEVILANADFELSMIDVANKELTVNGMLCKASELEDIIIVQPIAYMTSQDHETLMQCVEQLSTKGELNGKSVLILPYDMRLLKTKLAK